MLSPIGSTFRTLAIAAAVLFALPDAYAQQPSGTGPALPPPSLYDDISPPPAQATVPPAPVRLPTATQPAPVREPVAAPAPARTTAPAAVETAPAPYVPAETPPPAPAPVESRPAAVPVESAPVATHTEAIEPQAVEEPWYRRLWPFGRKKSEPAPAAAPEQAAAAPVVVPPGRQGEGRPPYAYDTPSKTIRTTVIGDCVKTGFWDTDRWGHGACPGTTPEPAPVAAHAPTPAPVPPVAEPEPVQVQPLRPEPMEEPRALAPEPEPVAAPPPPPPPAPVVKTTTLAADTLFALNSFQLRPTAKAKLDDFAAELDQFDYERIRITGHTDPTGSAQLNERLSRQRAQAVKSYLVSKGLPASKIVTEGMGSAMPMVTDKDCSKLPRGQMVACFQPDRRVDIEVTGARIAHK